MSAGVPVASQHVADAGRRRPWRRGWPTAAEAQHGPVRVVIWTSIPTHHQSAFFAALRDQGVQLQVFYLQAVTPDRIALGWSVPDCLPPGERYLESGEDLTQLVAAYDLYVHIVPGANFPVLIRLCKQLCAARVPWVHWSEPGRPRSAISAKAFLRRVYARIVNQYALGAFAIGEMARRDFERWGIEPDRIHFLPYSIAGLEAPDEAGPQHDELNFTQVGVLCERKGTDLLLEAFASVRARHPRCRLHLVGNDVSHGAYRAAAARLGLEASVTWHGSVPADQVAAHMARAHVVVLASRFDGWGVALNEAASLGRALIATDMTGSAHHLIRDGWNGFRVGAGEVNGLARAMDAYAAAPPLAAEHGERSRALFDSFTPAANAQRFRDGLASLLC